ncbi:MAG: bifunctional YncE family protein/alkaline phosphatase family protein [Planctomycetes bacterium]|nr:bifunctional YncE family protein/alkaline phosphatase family protein [Planctomycetota bacterium]
MRPTPARSRTPWLLLACSLAACNSSPERTPAPRGLVGRNADGSLTTPVQQELTPLGVQVELPGQRPGAIARSADRRFVYVSGKSSEMVVVAAGGGNPEIGAPQIGAVVQRVRFPSERQQAPVDDFGGKDLEPDTKALLSYTGLITSPDGRRIYASNVKGSIKVFAVDDDGVVHASHTIRLPNADAPRRAEEIPSGLCLSADGSKLYVCANLSNRVHEIDTATGAVLRSVDVGVAPYDVLLVGGKLFVSNWGGARPKAGDVVGPAGRGTEVRVDPVTHVAADGSVSVIALDTFAVTRETKLQRHSSALAASPDGHWVVCANAGSDSVSVLDAKTGALRMTLSTKARPSDLLSASPNALCFDDDGERLFVANGTMNAIAVIAFEPDDPEDCRVTGLLPVGWYPAALSYDEDRDQLAVANLKGLALGRLQGSDAGYGPGAAESFGDGRPREFNTHQYHGTLSLLTPPDDDEELAALSLQVETNLRCETIAQALLPPRSGQPPRAIPERIGEPSLIEHVVYVIKENRTYDQVLGDMSEGNGDPALCIFGEQITPNQHALAREFVLLDNTYCAGILSADGHQWSTAAFATDYLERSFAGWPRSYPDGMGEDEDDALSYSPVGFLWDHAIRAGVTLRNFGEFCGPKVRWRDANARGTPGFSACYDAWQGSRDDVVFESQAMVPPLEPYTDTGYVGWNMSVPDQFRADRVIRWLARCEQDGVFPQLTFICLPQDHTSGTSRNCPTPRACVADNDLAVGRIVEALGKSRFWASTAVFVIEDDPQAGWDHVSGYRTTCYVASPYARRGEVVSARYSTTSVLRTMEQILGIPPMNVFDAAAVPMWECFIDEPDLRPFAALPSNVPLDELNPDPKAIADPALRADAVASAKLDFEHVDRAPEDVLNRILWRAMKGDAPYPEWAITPGADADDD